MSDDDTEQEIYDAVKKIAQTKYQTIKPEYDLADSADILSQDIDDLERAVEAILFASSEPLKPSEIAEYIGAEAGVGNALARLKRHYKGRGVTLVEVGGGWRFQTSSDLALLLNKHREEPKKLSNAAMETLAIIAYHQPCTRAEIEEIRGVTVGKGTIDFLMELKWVKYGARRRTVGKPMTYKTTEQFLSHFNLSGLDDLPGKAELQAQGLLSANLPKDFEIPKPFATPNNDLEFEETGNEADFVTDFFTETE